MFLLWVALIPWAAWFSDAADGRHSNQQWVYLPLYGVMVTFPLVVIFSYVRLGQDGRAASLTGTLFVLANALGWVLSLFVAAMAISGSWM